MDSTTAASRKRRRPALSCAQCRRRKIKCDRNTPCAQCTQSKSSTTCSYSPDDAAAPVNRRVNAADLPVAYSTPISLGSLDRASNNSGVRVSGSSINHPSSPRAVPLVENAQYGGRSPWKEPTVQGFHSESTVQDLRDRIHKLEQLLSESKSRQPADSRDVSSVAETAPHLRGSLSKTRFFGQSHWMNFIDQFDTIGRFKGMAESIRTSTSKPDGQISELFGLLEKCKKMARAAKAERPIQSFMLPDFKSSIPSREVSDQLVHLYLRTFESAYRILHIPSFQKECAQYWNDPQTASTGFVVKLLLVMAIGSCFYQNENNDDTLRSLVPQWVYAGQWWLSAASEKSGLNLAGLQVHCLMLLAHQTNALGGDLIWISAGSLLRTAFNMGLHRDPKYFPKMSTFYSELRRRLWATILEMAIQSSLDSGMPPLISLQDFDCEPPSNIDDAEIDEATKTSPASKPNSSFTQTSIQITLLKSLPTRLEVAILINDFRTDPSYDKVLRLGADITNACRESALIMQSHLSFPIQRDSTRPTEFHKNLLDLFTRRYLLTLHRPFAIKAKTDPRFYFSRKVCLESAMTIVSYVGDLSATSNVQDDFSRLMVRGRGAFRDVMFSDAAIAICLELITQLEEEASNGSSNAALTQPSMINKLARSAREPIIQAVKQMVELAARRIALGETNVKGHVLLSAALAQITAMEAGEPPEHAIFEAAKQSAKSCYALLRARTTSAPADLDEQHAPEERSGLGTGGQQDFDFDVLMQDESLNLDISNSWLFSGWEENNLWL